MNDMVKWNSKVVSEHQHRGKDGSWERTEGKDRMGLEELVETCMLMAQYVKFFSVCILDLIPDLVYFPASCWVPA